MTEQMPHLRSDARDNRDRVLAAARELFADSGLEVTMRRVARHAGVGPATLYRRFPTKQHLVLAAFADELHECRAIVHDGLADPDPWRGFCGILERSLVLNARNQGFTDAFLAAYPEAVDLAAHRRELAGAVAAVARRAQVAGALRTDFVFDDFTLVLLAGRGLSSAPAGSREAAARRLAALTVESLRTRTDNAPLPAPARVSATLVDGPTAAS